MPTRGLLACAAIAGVLLLPEVARAETVKLGVVDVKRVMDSVPAWQKAVDALKAEWDKKQKLLQDQQDSLRKQKEQIDAKKMVTDPKVLAKEQASLLEKAQQLADTFLIQQQLIARQEIELKSQMLSRIEPIVNGVAVEGDFTFIFESGTPQQPNVLYSATKIDVSDAVVARYKKRYKDKPFDIPSAEEIARQIERAAAAAAGGGE